MAGHSAQRGAALLAAAVLWAGKETASRAGISPQYLSEVERGRKEPSSEMIAALAGALGTTLIGLTEQVAGELRRQQGISASRASGPVMLALAA